jgi:hypothetical protein
MTSDAWHFGIIENADANLVVSPDQAESGADAGEVVRERGRDSD